MPQGWVHNTLLLLQLIALPNYLHLVSRELPVISSCLTAIYETSLLLLIITYIRCSGLHLLQKVWEKMDDWMKKESVGKCRVALKHNPATPNCFTLPVAVSQSVS